MKPAPGNRTVVVAAAPAAMLPRLGKAVVVGVLLSSTLVSCTFVAVPPPALVIVRVATTSFVTGTSPVNFNVTGTREFCSTEEGVIRFDAGNSGATPVTTVSDCQAFTTMQ